MLGPVSPSVVSELLIVMRAARRSRPRVKACRRASDRRVTPACQHAAGIPGRSKSAPGVELAPARDEQGKRSAARRCAPSAFARASSRRQRRRRPALSRPPTSTAASSKGSHATVPHSRRPSHLTGSAPASRDFCLRSTAGRSGTRDPTAPAATLQKCRATGQSRRWRSISSGAGQPSFGLVRLSAYTSGHRTCRACVPCPPRMSGQLSGATRCSCSRECKSPRQHAPGPTARSLLLASGAAAGARRGRLLLLKSDSDGQEQPFCGGIQKWTAARRACVLLHRIAQVSCRAKPSPQSAGLERSRSCRRRSRRWPSRPPRSFRCRRER